MNEINCKPENISNRICADLDLTLARNLNKEVECKLQQLKAENESLQSLNDFNVQKIETLEAENEFKESEINDWIKQYKLAHQKYMKLQTKNEKYKQCLDKIEELLVVDGCTKCPYGEDVVKKCKRNIEPCVLRIKGNILQLIKQAKED